MIDINKLRLLVQDCKLAGSPVFVRVADMNEILDRLEVVEKERLDVVQRLADSERELSRLRKAWRTQYENIKSIAQDRRKITEERDALQAKVEAMEKQFPICRVKDLKRARYMTKVVGLDPDAWLYLAPGAQPAPTIAEQDQINAEAAIRSIYGAQPAPITPEGWKLVPIEPTPSMAASVELSTVSSVSDIYLAMLAAAPEAKP